METKIIAVILSCMDCRLHDPDAGIIMQLRDILGADAVYLPSVAGPDGSIIKGGPGKEKIVSDIQIAVDGGASIVGTLSHYDCKGYPVSDEEHRIATVRASKELGESLERYDGQPVSLVARPRKKDEDFQYTWVVEKISVH